MKVKELIEKLSTVNPEWTVLYSCDTFYNETIDLIQGEYCPDGMGFLDVKSLTPNAVVLGEK